MSRKGSALLVVLGVLAFLTVSAVAFSAFMRRARLPSSYLRRNVAARQLAKAAVAEAVDEIDRGIANNVHPGIGSSSGNTWRNRVYCRSGGSVSLLESVPVMTLEGLAYIPPPLVNEARYWARKTPTASWQPFGYDVGRFAYLALDVSDYFDVNRMIADSPRSSAPNGRIRISHLFEDVNHKKEPTDASAWDDWMENFRKFNEQTLEVEFDSSGKMPLVSMADFNLALGDKGEIGRIRSPFCDYVKSEGGSFYTKSGSNPSASELEIMQAMTFVTDGWFPCPDEQVKTTSNGQQIKMEVFDLNNGLNQPFAMANLQEGKTKLSTALFGTGMQSKLQNEWLSYLNGLGCVALADYLDADRVPISLAVPTVERTPMICAIRPSLGGKTGAFAVDKDPGAIQAKGGGKPVEKGTERTVEQTVAWKIKSAELQKAFMAGYVQALVTYPFLHKDESDDQHQYSMDGKFSLFFSSEDAFGLRTSSKDVLHPVNSAQQDFPDSTLDANGVLSVKLTKVKPSPATLADGIAEQEADAVWASQIADMSLMGGATLATRLSQAGNELLSVTYTWKQTRTQKADGTYTEWEPDIAAVMAEPKKYTEGGSGVKAKCGMTPLKANGAVDEDFTEAKLSGLLLGGASKHLRLNAAVWLRIRDTSKQKTVDLVPACYDDDKTQNLINETDARVRIIANDEFSGAPYPVMRFDTGVDFNFSVAELDKLAENSAGTPIEISPKAVMVADPRYNYAPEHWFRYDGAGEILSPEEWLQNNGCGSGDAEDDIFMATSDAGYLQSANELAFLPRFTDLKPQNGAATMSGFLQRPDRNAWTSFQSRGNEANHNLMWVNYDPMGMDEAAFDILPFTSEGTGTKVNPYSDSTNVLMAVFANTPLDWRRASTNVMPGGVDYAAKDVGDFNKTCAWNGYSSGGCLEWGDLERVASRFADAVRNNKYSTWQQAWNDLGWYSSGKDDEFLGVKLSATSDRIWSCDRKYLYGFWRDCFGAKQQLFLIFVRAEPLMLAGGNADQLPPQLGARAVALVWRDPTPTTSENSASGSGYPHRTRVLFYKPLD